MVRAGAKQRHGQAADTASGEDSPTTALPGTYKGQVDSERAGGVHGTGVVRS